MSNISGISLGWSEYPTQYWALNIYISGCSNNCPDCHNLELQDPSHGTNYSLSEIYDIILNKSKSNRTNSIVLLGGDPLYPDNINFTDQLIQTLNSFDICLYTGYDLSHAVNSLRNIYLLKYLKTGRYIPSFSQNSKKTDTHLILSSSNQIMYKVDGDNLNQISENGIVTLQPLTGTNHGIHQL